MKLYEQIGNLEWKDYCNYGFNGLDHLVDARLGYEVIKHKEQGKNPEETLGLIPDCGFFRIDLEKASRHVYLPRPKNSRRIPFFNSMLGLCGHEVGLICGYYARRKRAIFEGDEEIVEILNETKDLVNSLEKTRNYKNRKIRELGKDFFNHIVENQEFGDLCKGYLRGTADLALDGVKRYAEYPEDPRFLIDILSSHRDILANNYMPKSLFPAYKALMEKYHAEIHEK